MQSATSRSKADNRGAGVVIPFRYRSRQDDNRGEARDPGEDHPCVVELAKNPRVLARLQSMLGSKQGPDASSAQPVALPSPPIGTGTVGKLTQIIADN